MTSPSSYALPKGQIQDETSSQGNPDSYESTSKAARSESLSVGDNRTRDEPAEAPVVPAMEYFGGIRLALVVVALLLSMFLVPHSP